MFYIGCAGGVGTNAYMDVLWEETPSHHRGFELSVSGLKGGHSGAEIHTQRANAIKLAARILTRLDEYRVFKATGGSKRNVIPSTATIGFSIPKEDEDRLYQVVETVLKEVKGEFEVADPHIAIDVTKMETPKRSVVANTLFDALYAAPHGVDAMSMSIEGIVETSTNLAILSLDEKGFYVSASHRFNLRPR